MAGKGKLEFYKDELCTIPADFIFGEIKAGQAKSIVVYAKNTGPTLLRDLVASFSIPEIEIDENNKTLKPKEIWKMIITWKPKIDMPEKNDIREDLRVLGTSKAI